MIEDDAPVFPVPGGQQPRRSNKYVTMAGWDDVPHLTQEQKDQLFAAIPPYQRDARSKGIPQLGAGAIYPVPESEIVVDPFPIPDYYRQAYGLDVGWNRTAAIFGALDPEADILYLTNEHYRGMVEPPVHAAAIQARGSWLPGVIDPAARGRGQRDGERLLLDYQNLGLNLTAAFNGQESGIYEVWLRLTTGRLKVFKTMQNWLGEYRLYRRDEKGQIVKKFDHAMDGTRYLVVSGIEVACVRPPNQWSLGRQQSQHQYNYDPAAGQYGISDQGRR